MYGLVNQGIKDLVVSKFGQEVWMNVCDEAESPDDFVSMQYYDDAITYRLVGAVSKLLSVPAEGVLREFGIHWVRYTGQEGYGPIMDLFGADFKTCLKNLNHMHTRMGISLPDLKPPSFTYREITDRHVQLEYKSTRKGLSPMVRGLLEGLAKKYNIRIEVQAPDDSDENKVFDIFIKESA